MSRLSQGQLFPGPPETSRAIVPVTSASPKKFLMTRSFPVGDDERNGDTVGFDSPGDLPFMGFWDVYRRGPLDLNRHRVTGRVDHRHGLRKSRRLRDVGLEDGRPQNDAADQQERADDCSATDVLLLSSKHACRRGSVFYSANKL
jgi:hypothetical protein